MVGMKKEDWGSMIEDWGVLGFGDRSIFGLCPRHILAVREKKIIIFTVQNRQDSMSYPHRYGKM